MANFENWNIEKYFCATEPARHWELKKSFINAYKDKFPEQRLICLAQVFCNIEFLGCSYSPELMDLVQNLAGEINLIKSYRAEKKNKLKRTFVQASDAAQMNRNPSNGAKRSKPVTEVCKIEQADHDLLLRAQKQPGWRGKLVLFNSVRYTQTSYSKFRESASKCGVNVEIVKGQPDANLTCEYSLLVDGEQLATCIATSAGAARLLLADMVYPTLTKHCFTIVTEDEFAGESIAKDLSVKNKNGNIPEAPQLPENNIGTKMMLLMGWSGQGLGKHQNGIQQPIEASVTVNRGGLGLTAQSPGFAHQIKKFLQRYIREQQTHNLIFAKDFTKEERAKVHEIAQRFKLKSKSYGCGENRQLIVKRKLTPWEFVKDLLTSGGRSDNYTLIKPTDV